MRNYTNSKPLGLKRCNFTSHCGADLTRKMGCGSHTGAQESELKPKAVATLSELEARD
jgi:hypothetical protein